MRPTFRTDLKCAREEQQGVVFYRVDDPQTQTSFRLYEIEYLIAKKLDGQLAIPEVIRAVKESYNFDISEPDLQKFVSQLESMGFVGLGGEEAPAQGPPDQEAAVMPHPIGGGLEMDEPGGEVSDSDSAELHRLLKSALLHVKQGYIVHARDYFLAAKELNPSDQRLSKLVSHLEIIGDASGPAEVEYLWNQAKEFFPDVAEEVGPLAELPSGASGTPGDSGGLATETIDGDLRSRILWSLLFIVLLVVAGGGLWYVFTVGRILESAARVRVTSLKAQRLPILHDGHASEVLPGREEWLSFASAGKVAEVHANEGDRVNEDEILAILQLKGKMGKKFNRTRAQLEKAQVAHDRTLRKLDEVLSEREAIEADRTAAEDKLKELRPKSVLSQGGVSKRDLEKWKRVKVKANKQLSRLAKKERGPKKEEANAKKKLVKAQKQLAAAQRKIAQKLIRAPFAASVKEVAVQPGSTVKPTDKVVQLRDNLVARIAFNVPDAAGRQPGGEAHVVLSRGAPSRAKIDKVSPAEGGTRLEVTIVDPSGGFVDMPPSGFRLVKEFVRQAFSIPVGAVFQGAESDKHFVFVAVQGRAILREVEVLARDASSAIIRSDAGVLRDGEQLVVGRVGDEEIAEIADGSFLETVNN